MRRVSACVFFLLAGACASSAPQGPSRATSRADPRRIQVRIRPSASNVVGTLEQPATLDVAGLVWVENTSTDTVVVVAVTLHECRNVRQECEVPIERQLALPPGARHVAVRVMRAAAGGACHVTFTFDWSAEGAVRHGRNSSAEAPDACKAADTPPESRPGAR